MKIYTASQELIETLLRNGLTEITKEMKPDHFKRLQKDGYDPRKIKRVFAVKCYGYKKNYLELDYETIKPLFKGGAKLSDMKKEITDDDLKSLIGFYKLSHKEKKRTNMYSLESYYKSILQHPQYYKNKLEATLFVEMYESIIV
jgi:hypothetical protein